MVMSIKQATNVNATDSCPNAGNAFGIDYDKLD